MHRFNTMGLGQLRRGFPAFEGGDIVLFALAALYLFIFIIFIFMTVRWILRYRLECKKIEAGYYQQLAHRAPQPEAARVQAGFATKRAYRNALLLLAIGVFLYLLDMGILVPVGALLIFIGLIWLISILPPGDETFLSKIGGAINGVASKVSLEGKDSKQSSLKDKDIHRFHRLLLRALILLGLGIGFLIPALLWRRPFALFAPVFAIFFGLGLALTIYYIVVRRDFKYIHSDEKEKGESEPPQEEIKHPEGSDENQSVQNP